MLTHDKVTCITACRVTGSWFSRQTGVGSCATQPELITIIMSTVLSS